ncbi:MAG: type II toxin-antitoxin system RelE family toxin [Gammaproteobacteria bacterium]
MAVRFVRQAEKNARKILHSDARIAASLHKRISELQQNPVPPAAKAMKNMPAGTYRIAFGGDYGRIVYFVDGDDLEILAVGTRQNIYKKTD